MDVLSDSASTEVLTEAHASPALPAGSSERVKRHRQLRLMNVDVGSPLPLRLGGDFFKGLPAAPGVYFFYNEAGRLLYIGQSNNLRARVGSYRHVVPERNPRRTLRLVHAIARVEWKVCLTHDEAKELERCLLLEHRPPFNRAGVWPGLPWWLGVDVISTGSAGTSLVQVRLCRAGQGPETEIGPLPASFRFVKASLLRCVYRLLNPGVALSQYPMGMLNLTIPLTMSLRMDAAVAAEMAEGIIGFATGTDKGAALMAKLEGIMTSCAEGTLEHDYWTVELEGLRKYAAKAMAIAQGEVGTGSGMGSVTSEAAAARAITHSIHVVDLPLFT